MGKQIKTALVAFCWSCSMAHIREHVAYDKEAKETYCKRTGRVVHKDGFHPPIPVMADEEDVFDPTYYGGDDSETSSESQAPSIVEMIPAMLEEVVSAAGGDVEIHKDEITQMAITIASWIGKKNEQSEKVVQMHLIGEIDGNTQKRAKHLAQHL